MQRVLFTCTVSNSYGNCSIGNADEYPYELAHVATGDHEFQLTFDAKLPTLLEVLNASK